jgi:predicted MPP superfamily phosphohydrolase
VNLIVPFFPSALVTPTDQTKLLLFALLTSGVGIVVALGAWNAARPRLKNLRLHIAKDGRQLPSIRIAVASDIHLGTIVSTRRLKRIVGMINELQPDLVLLPGDVVDEDLAPVIRYNLGETLRTIKARYGVIAITGNHEYIGGVEAAVRYLQEHGMVVLRDNAVLIANSLYIIGREDRSIGQFAGGRRIPLADLMKDVDRSFPLILMDHQPFHLEEAEQAGVDMQLSGHTHHGQLWPFNYITNKVYEVSWGYKQKGNTHIYVSCGVGTWGPPVRTGNRPEILMIELTFDAA